MFFYDQGCTGRIRLGDLPREIRSSLGDVPGEWLEYDAPTSAIVLRHTQPSTSPPLPTIAGELVRLLAAVGPELQNGIPGGDIFIHPEEPGQLVRMRVDPGGTLHIQWAHPDYTKATRRPYAGGEVTSIDPEVQRLDGLVTFSAPDSGAAARILQGAAESFEGLYPEGDFSASVSDDDQVVVRLREVNLDSALLAARLAELADPGTLNGAFEVTSLSGTQPEEHVRFLFEDGKAWVQRPILWDHRNKTR